MKLCPKCQLKYEDNFLEFCLEDGTKLVSTDNFNTEIPTITHTIDPTQSTAKTVSLPFSTPAGNNPLPSTADKPNFSQVGQIKEKAIEKSNKILEVAPVVAALAHNWWQWIYLNNQTSATLTAFLFSANFLIWMLLLIAGALLGLLALKRLQNKGFAVIALVTIAINFILFLVPKR